MHWPLWVMTRLASFSKPLAGQAQTDGPAIAAELAKTKDFDGVTGEVSVTCRTQCDQARRDSRNAGWRTEVCDNNRSVVQFSRCFLIIR